MGTITRCTPIHRWCRCASIASSSPERLDEQPISCATAIVRESLLCGSARLRVACGRVARDHACGMLCSFGTSAFEPRIPRCDRGRWPLNFTSLLRRNRTQTLDCSVAFFLMITYFQLMRPYCMPELRRRARELATFIWHPHQRRDDADPCAATSTSGPTAPRAMPAHATPAYATPACHPPRDTRCRPRRVSHHPSLLARQKQRLATYSTIKVCGASPHTPHTHTPHTPHIHHTSRCLPTSSELHASRTVKRGSARGAHCSVCDAC